MKIKSTSDLALPFVLAVSLAMVGCETTQKNASRDEPEYADPGTPVAKEEPAVDANADAVAARDEAMLLAEAEPSAKADAKAEARAATPPAPEKKAETPATPPAEPTPAPEKTEPAAPETKTPEPTPEPAPAATTTPAPAPITEVKPEEAPAAAPTPADATTYEGRISIVNQKKGFVVIDFQQTGVPPVRSEMGVYRDNQFVGSIRITPPVKGSMATADTLTGTLRRGDVVR